MRPTLKKFTDAVARSGGNLTKVAEMFHVARSTVYSWIRSDARYRDVVEDSRMRLFDECLATARIAALGIPKIKDGKMVGWTERPDTNLIRYLIGTLGRKEGFGESIDVTSGGEKLSVNLFRVLTKDEVEDFDNEFDRRY